MPARPEPAEVAPRRLHRRGRDRRRLGGAFPGARLRRRRLGPGAGRREPAARAGRDRLARARGARAGGGRLARAPELRAHPRGRGRRRAVRAGERARAARAQARAARGARSRDPARGGDRLVDLGLRDDRHAAGHAGRGADGGRAPVQPALSDPAGRGGRRRPHRSGCGRLGGRVLSGGRQVRARDGARAAGLHRQPAAGCAVARGAPHGRRRRGDGRRRSTPRSARGRACAGRSWAPA